MADRVTLRAVAVVAAGLLVLFVGLQLVVDRQQEAALDAGLAAEVTALTAALEEDGDVLLEGEPYAELVPAAGGPTVRSPALANSGARLLAGPSGPGDRYLDRTVQLRRGPLPLRVLARRLPDGRTLALGRSTIPIEEDSERRLVALAVTAPLLLLLLGLTVTRSVHAALRPVDRMAREAASISAGEDTDRRLHVREGGGDDEIGRLATTLDDMLGRLSVAFQRERAFVDDAAHELRTPIAVLRGELELALSDLGDAEGVRTSLEAARAETGRLERLAEELLVLARQRAGVLLLQPLDVDLPTWAHEVSRRLAPSSGLTIEVDVPAVCWRFDPDRLQQAVGNLVGNAAAAGAGHVRLGGRVADGVLELDVDDDGPGFPDALLPAAFERFTRGDAARTRSGGAGLGLALVAALQQAAGGTVSARNGGPLGGATVQLRLPGRSGLVPPTVPHP